MSKYIITFGSGQLEGFNINASSVMLVIEADSEREAREIVFSYEGIGENFCTSYSYEKYAEKFINGFNMKEYSLEDLEKTRR